MNSNLFPLLEKLYSLQRLGIKTGLKHTEQLLDACQNPQNNLKCIHVAGTNGKGSTCAMIYSILKETGLKVGLYTSPHLIRFNERIRVNGIPITDNDIITFINSYWNDIEKIESTFFETTTAMAFWYFNQKKVDYAIIETGLGGRLDSTNVIIPEISVITRVSLDHCDILGDNIVTIAGEKAGIIKKNIPVISSDQTAPARSVFIEKAGSIGTSVQFISFPNVLKVVPEGTVFSYRESQWTTSLLGEHQAMNAALAIEAIGLLNLGADDHEVNRGLMKTMWPGRFQMMSPDSSVIYDVAHNAEGIHRTLITMKRLFKEKPVGLIALKEDKELTLVAEALRGHFKAIWTMDDEQLIQKGELSDYLKRVNIQSKPIENLEQFFHQVSHSQPCLIFGSHYISDKIFSHFHFSFDNGRI